MTTSEYFEALEEEAKAIYSLADEARTKFVDPFDTVEAIPTRNLAERVEGLVGPQYISDEIKKLQEEGLSREKIVEKVIDWILKGTYFKAGRGERIEQALRTALAILTEGVVSAPLEGISKVIIEKNPDGSNYLSVYFSGPIRGAGGTAAALSVLLADYIRQKEGISDFRPTESEVERYKEELEVYHKRVVRLQYMPTPKEIEIIIRNVPVCIDGDPTEEQEVDVHKNLERVKTNRIRGGVCLVIGEGLAQKYKKVAKFAEAIQINGWDWIKNLREEKDETEKEKKSRISAPNPKYLEDIVAGRPIFSYPSTAGGFRLRYGRSNMCGIASKAIHPATMEILDEFPVVGTQMRIERPGKGMIAVPCSSIEGPVVKLKNGNVVRIEDAKKAVEINDEVSEILFLGDILVPFGDFLNSNERLVPSGYVEEWWIKDYNKLDLKKINPYDVTANEAVELSLKHKLPLHPRYTYFWHDLTVDELRNLVRSLSSTFVKYDSISGELTIKPDSENKKILEKLCVPHDMENDNIIIKDGEPFLLSLGFDGNKFPSADSFIGSDALSAINSVSKIKIMRKTGAYIGARMGRPEKAKERKMKVAPHVLFPVGENGGRSRSVDIAAQNSLIKTEVARMRCAQCKKLTFLNKCSNCNTKTYIEYKCRCGAIGNEPICKRCGQEAIGYEEAELPIKKAYQLAIERLNTKSSSIVKGVKGMTSTCKLPEALEKGILRSKNGVFVFKDGTIRFDATDIPTTHFRAGDVNVPIEKLIDLGYDKDVDGKPLENEEQFLELKVQDVIIPENALGYIFKVANFVDDELKLLYKMEPFYNLTNEKDLIGHLVLGLAPHTSAAILGRIIGYSNLRGIIAHPYWHAAKRRNCMSPDTKILALNSDKLTSFSLGELYEKSNQQAIMVDDFGSELKKISGVKAISFNEALGTYEQKPIKSITRVPAQSALIKIVTKSGRTMTVSKEHKLVAFENTKFVTKRALELKESDNLLLPSFAESQANYFNQDGSLENLSDQSLLQLNSTTEVKFDPITLIEIVKNDGLYLYDIEVEDNHNFLLHNMLLSNNCDGDEDSVMLLLDVLLNFSKFYLPEKRGGRMDAPLVVNIKLDPKEVDAEAHCIEIVKSYNEDFYLKTQKYPLPKEVSVDTVGNHLDNNPYENLHCTHLSSWKGAPTTTKYVQLKDMVDKTREELRLCEKIRAVDEKDVAKRLLDSHLIRDTYGNLRAFARQKFRCVKCNKKFRRTPLIGKCDKCGGRIILTVSRGTVEKYLNLTMSIINKYVDSEYIRQRVELVDKEIKSVFENEKSKQVMLADFV